MYVCLYWIHNILSFLFGPELKLYSIRSVLFRLLIGPGSVFLFLIGPRDILYYLIGPGSVFLFLIGPHSIIHYLTGSGTVFYCSSD